VVGKIINGFVEVPFALPILHDEQGRLVIDAALFGEDDLLMLFSFARAYFMVDMEVPSAYVQFLRTMMPRKPRAELYNALGLAKQGKTLFYRDFLYHLKHSSDRFRIAPGIKGMVMLVFDLPSFPYVFKIIKDWYPPPKDTSVNRCRANTCWSSSTTAWAAWPTRWSTAWWRSRWSVSTRN
jgi:isocitrate dehydrogenase kinase/phosphatase